MANLSEPRVNTGRSLRTIAVAAFLVAFAVGQGSKQRHFSTRQGRTIRMRPSGVSLQIPEDWDGLYVERTELEKVKRGRGEWYREYAKVANAALPFTDCSVQAGRYLWSSPGVGITMRGYVLGSSGSAIDAKVASKALAAAQALPSPTVRNASLKQTEVEQWHRNLITYDVWYVDYGGRANVDFYSTEVEGNSVVLVFMYDDVRDNLAAVQQILKSFSKQ
jgi:hypothetical protein